MTRNEEIAANVQRAKTSIQAAKDMDIRLMKEIDKAVQFPIK